MKVTFNEDIVNSLIQTWCDNVVKIGNVYTNNGDVEKAANRVLSQNYDYDKGKVLFKPTLAFGENTFRPTKEGALSYFIGNNNNYPFDNGFKLKPWVKAWFTDLDYIISGELAIVQCNVHLIGADDTQIFVNKSFVFKINDNNEIKIILHHSSLPYIPN